MVVLVMSSTGFFFAMLHRNPEKINLQQGIAKCFESGYAGCMAQIDPDAVEREYQEWIVSHDALRNRLWIAEYNVQRAWRWVLGYAAWGAIGWAIAVWLAWR